MTNPPTKQEALAYKKEDLEGHIEKCKENTKIFEDAIKKEQETIERDKQMIAIIEANS